MLKRDDAQAGALGGLDENWTRVEGLRVRYFHGGSGPAIVFLHGLLGYSFNWRRVLPQVAQSHEVFVPDLPGAGFSECNSKLDCRLSASARRLLGFLDALGIQAADLIA